MDSQQAVVDGGMSITGVTLFDNGYAVFRRETTIQGHGSIDLYFSSGHMKSVLETLQFAGPGGKKVGNIAYEATKPVANIDLPSTDPLVGLLRTLVGRLISIQHINNKENNKEVEVIEGRVLGVDERIGGVCFDKKTLHVSLLMDGGFIKSIPMEAVHNFHILETQVKQDIAFSLDLKRSTNDLNLQKLSVFYSDVESPLPLIAKYGFCVNEWKSSYRLKISDHPTQFKLDGLAIVENTLDEDWNDVELTLVVGAPAIESSKRAVADEGQWRLSIKTLDGSYTNVRANPRDSVISLQRKLATKLHISFGSFRLMFSGKSVDIGRQLSDYTISNNSTLHMEKVVGSKDTGAMSGQSFVMAAHDNLSYYHIPMRVTARRKQKAIIPLLQAELEGQKVVLYDETIRKGNPLQALLFENTTGRTLEGGSLQISTDADFLGQGILPTLHPGDESSPIPFAVELNCEVIKSSDNSFLKPHLVTIANGTVTIVRIHRVITLYKIKHKGKNSLDFLLNHLFLEDYDLLQRPDIEEEEPVDITDRFYQFRFSVPPMIEKKTFIVREEINDLKEHEVTDVDNDLLSKWVEKELVNSETEKKIKDVLNVKKEISKIERGVYEKQSEIREITSTQERLRQIISSLEGHEKEAYKYVKSLSTEEDKLKQLTSDIKKDQSKKKELEKTRATKATAIHYEVKFIRSAAEE